VCHRVIFYRCRNLSTPVFILDPDINFYSLQTTDRLVRATKQSTSWSGR